MLDLDRLFVNHFDTPKIGAEALRGFAEDHLAKLRGHQKSARLAVVGPLVGPTQTALAEFDAALSRRADLLAAREGGTVGKDDVMRLFKTRLRQREGRVRDKFGAGSATYEEFFPRGLAEYSQASVGRMKVLLDRVVEKCTKHQADLGADLAAEFAALRQQFEQARGGQMESSGGLAEARSQVATARTALELRLMTNILTLALQHLGEPDRAKDYFEQSLLGDSARPPAAEEPAATPAPVAG